MGLHGPELTPLVRALISIGTAIIGAVAVIYVSISLSERLKPYLGIDNTPVWTLFLAGGGVVISLLLRIAVRPASVEVGHSDLDITSDLYSQAVVLNVGSHLIPHKSFSGMNAATTMGIVVSILCYVIVTKRKLTEGNLRLMFGVLMSLITMCYASYAFLDGA